MADPRIRPERPEDVEAIGQVVTSAFANARHSDGTEAAIVSGLRNAGALTLSLVADEDGAVIGHVAFSPVLVDGSVSGWFGLGPVAVMPDCQRRGVGRALVREGLALLRKQGALGCVVLGDPAYYAQFGLGSDGTLSFGAVPPEYLQQLPFGDDRASGEVVYHPAFAAE